MITRGQVLVEEDRSQVFPLVLESCKEVKAKMDIIDDTEFYIHGKSPTLWNRYGAKLEIFLRSSEEGTLIEIYDHLPIGPDKRFLERLFKALAKRIPLQTQYVIEAVNKEDINRSSDQNLDDQEHDNKSMIDISLIKKYEYDLEMYASSQTNKLNVNKIIIYPVEIGSRIEFLNESEVESYLPLSWIEKITTSAETKGLFGNKNDLYIEIFFKDPNNETGSVKLNLQDKHVQEALKVIQSSMEAERQQYWDEIEIQYKDSSESIKTTKITPKAPFLSLHEELLWINHIPEGIINKHAGYLQAITNFRVFEYDYSKHICSYIMISSLEDVIIMNKKTSSHTNRIGNYMGARNLNMMTGIGTSTTKLNTVGDLVFIYEGKPFIKFMQISEPDGLDKLILSAKKQLVSLSSNLQKQQSNSESISNDFDNICGKCSTSNLRNAKFCNNCGMKLINECSKCNTINPQNSNFCNNCGMSLV